MKFIAIIILASGIGLEAYFLSQSACEAFTEALAPYVETANCYTLEN